jgi:hypothetical protein
LHGATACFLHPKRPLVLLAMPMVWKIVKDARAL